MDYLPLIGVALWALLPGFIAKSKGRSFLGYYILSFLVTPLATTIVALCVSDKNDSTDDNENCIYECISCGHRDEKYFEICPKCNGIRKQCISINKDDSNNEVECKYCGHIVKKENDSCPKCGMKISQPTEISEEKIAEIDKVTFCRKCGEKLIDNSQFCRKCGTEVIKE